MDDLSQGAMLAGRVVPSESPIPLARDLRILRVQLNCERLDNRSLGLLLVVSEGLYSKVELQSSEPRPSPGNQHVRSCLRWTNSAARHRLCLAKPPRRLA